MLSETPSAFTTYFATLILRLGQKITQYTAGPEETVGICQWLNYLPVSVPLLLLKCSYLAVPGAAGLAFALPPTIMMNVICPVSSTSRHALQRAERTEDRQIHTVEKKHRIQRWCIGCPTHRV